VHDRDGAFRRGPDHPCPQAHRSRPGRTALPMAECLRRAPDPDRSAASASIT
jgi:hypothetical protein